MSFVFVFSQDDVAAADEQHRIFSATSAQTIDAVHAVTDIFHHIFFPEMTAPAMPVRIVIPTTSAGTHWSVLSAIERGTVRRRTST